MTFQRYIAQWIFQLGFVLFLAGFGCNLASMLLGTEGKSRFTVWFRGSFQREQDYTSRGWRLNQAGRILAVLGILHIVIATMLAR